MNRKEITIQKVKRKMGEPIIKHLTDEDYSEYYDLAERIINDIGLDKEYESGVCKLLHTKILEVICKDTIEKNLNQNKDKDE